MTISVETTTDLAHENFLRPNGLGGYIVSISQLGSWARCNLQKHYFDVAAADPDAPQPENLSATEYGKVVHFCLMVMEQLRHEGDPDYLAKAIASFEHYWHPANISEVAEPVTQWLPRQTYGGLRDRGREVLTAYAGVVDKDESNLLALEYRFSVPLVIDGVTHTLSGIVDRLSIRRFYTKPYLCVADHKTGKQHTYLRYNMQGSAYCYATTTPEFWLGWEHAHREIQTFDQATFDSIGEYFEQRGYRMFGPNARYEGEKLVARKFQWVNLQEVKYTDGGWRNERDYSRLRLAVDGYIRQNLAGAYGLTLTGEICRFCAFRKTCGGIGLPDEKEGAP